MVSVLVRALPKIIHMAVNMNERNRARPKV